MINIAIDGTSGSGKSSVAKEIAKRLGFLHLNTGELYRAFAYYVIKNDIDYKSEDALKTVANKILINVDYILGSEQRTMLNGEYIGTVLHTDEVSKMSAVVSAYPCVRNKIKEVQRCIAHKNNVVVEGRDIGTVVLPFATFKFFLTATPEERAKRRYKQFVEAGEDVTYEKVLESIKKRDELDINREISPLVKADDAILIDSTDMTFEQVVNFILDRVR